MTTTMTTTPEKHFEGARGAANYPHFWLRLYDWWVLGVTTTHAWRCPTKTQQLPFFREHLSSNHLDIGVGTGYYLKAADIPTSTKVTLADLNIPSLEVAKRVFGREDVECIQHDVFEPLDRGRKFGSISMFYFVHCLPAPLEKKMCIFKHLKYNLEEEGVIYGTTILGPRPGVKHNLFGRGPMRLCNHMGTFDNWGDSREGIERALKAEFRQVETRVVGTILFFVAKEPVM